MYVLVPLLHASIPTLGCYIVKMGLQHKMWVLFNHRQYGGGAYNPSGFPKIAREQ